jgi:hypothetical protein
MAGYTKMSSRLPQQWKLCAGISLEINKVNKHESHLKEDLESFESTRGVLVLVQLPNSSLYVIPGGTCTFREAGIISAIFHYDSNYKQLLHVAAVT